MMKLNVSKAKVRVEMEYFRGGSILRGTVKSGCREVRTIFELESEEPEERLQLLIRNAKCSCFAENMVQTAVPLKSIIKVNGKEMDIREGGWGLSCGPKEWQFFHGLQPQDAGPSQSA